MSLQLYSQIPGTQVKRDVDLSNATIQCDPKLLFPEGATQGGVPLNKENLAGALAVEHDLCNLDVNNLTVNGALKVKGPAEVCDIVCPVDFNVTAERNVNMTADNDITLSAPGPGTGDILLTNAGAGSGAFIDLLSDDSILLRAQGTGIDIVANDGANSADVNIVATRDINVDSARALVLDSGSRGVSMKFIDTSSTSNLQITQGSGTVAQAQAGDVNGVCGKLEFSVSVVVPAGQRASVPILNDKVTVNSVILVTMDTQVLAVTDLVISSVSNIQNNGYDLEFGNTTGAPVDLLDVVIHYLVINPAI